MVLITNTNWVNDINNENQFLMICDFQENEYDLVSSV